MARPNAKKRKPAPQKLPPKQKPAPLTTKAEAEADAPVPVQPQPDFYIPLTPRIKELAGKLRVTFTEMHDIIHERAGQTALLNIKCFDSAAAQEAVAPIKIFGLAKLAIFPPPCAEYRERHKQLNLVRRAFDVPAVKNVDRILSAHARGLLSDGEVQRQLGDDPLLKVFCSNDELYFFLGQYLPAEFSGLVDDLAQSTLSVRCLPYAMMALVSAFVLAFRKLQVVNVRPVPPHEKRKDQIVRAHDELLELLDLIEREKSTTRPTEVDISKTDDSGLSISLNGGSVDPRSSRGRALMCLALLHHKDRFTVQEFVDLYFGQTTGDLPKEFNTIITRVPDIVVEKIQGETGVWKLNAVHFNVVVDDRVLSRALWDCYADEVRKTRPRP